MRLGKYEASQRSGSANTAITFLLIGLGAGALTALLLAPKGGKQMRKDLRRKYESARETFDDWTEDARETAESVYERGSEIADDLRDRVKPLAKAMRRG
jgi:gas vesicle protein